MKTPLEIFDVKNFLGEISEATTKFVKGAELFAGIDEIDVGTAPKELVYEEDKLKLYHYRPEGPVTCGVPVLIVYALVKPAVHARHPARPEHGQEPAAARHGRLHRRLGVSHQGRHVPRLDDYINGYMDACVDFVRKSARTEQVNLMGICQGGPSAGCTRLCTRRR